LPTDTPSSLEGAILSIKKIKGFQAQAKQITESIDALNKLFLDISSEDLKPIGHADTVKNILALAMPPPEKISDEDLVKELRSLCLVTRCEVADERKE
jgi:hypothetical protein